MQLSHEHPADDDVERLLGIGILLTLAIFLLELFGGLWTHSLAMMSDAWHVFIDTWSLVISFLAIYLAKRPATDRRTFGWHRMEVFAAFMNGLLVCLVGAGIMIAAIRRFQAPVDVHEKSLIALAALGLLLNITVAGLFYRTSHKDLNIRGAYLHVLGDALNTLAVLITGMLILITRSNRIDPVVSIGMAAVVLWGAVRLLREAFNTLLEGVPRGIQVAQVEKEILGIEGVVSVHDLHVWSICSHLNALSGHVLLGPEQMSLQQTILERINHSLKDRFGIGHTTIQVESKAWPGIEQAQNW